MIKKLKHSYYYVKLQNALKNKYVVAIHDKGGYCLIAYDFQYEKTRELIYEFNGGFYRTNFNYILEITEVELSLLKSDTICVTLLNKFPKGKTDECSFDDWQKN